METAIERASTTPEILGSLMTEEQAREVAGRIRRGIGELRQLLVEFREREGWRALGYANLDECCRAEFNIGRSHLYRQLTAGAVERALGVPIGDTKESHLRPLAGRSPEVQRQAFAEASEDGAPTAERVKRAVERIEQPAPEPEPEPTESPLERSLRIAREIQALQPPDPEPRVTVTPASAATDPAVQELARLAAAKTENRQPPQVSTTTGTFPDDVWSVGEIDRAFAEKRGHSLADVLRVYRAVVETAEDETTGSNRRAAARAYLKRRGDE